MRALRDILEMCKYKYRYNWLGCTQFQRAAGIHIFVHRELHIFKEHVPFKMQLRDPIEFLTFVLKLWPIFMTLMLQELLPSDI